MPTKVDHIAVGADKAAAMLDLTLPEFEALVDQKSVPPPVTIGQHKRWPVDQLRAILTGEAAKPDEDFEL